LACSFAPYYSEKLLHLAQSFQAASHAHLHATFEPRQMLRKHFSAHTPVAVHRPSQPVAMSQCVQRCNARYSVIRRLIRFDTAAATARPCVSVLADITRRRGSLICARKAAFGHCADLPRTGLLVCNLNAHYKIDTPTWIAWTNIIRRSADAVRTAAAGDDSRQA
jgi:hypothetical protein